MRLPPELRLDRTVDLPVGDVTVIVYRDGHVDLPYPFRGASLEQIVDELRAQGHLPPAPPVEATTVPEDHAYPCSTCGGAGWPCRACAGSGELVDRGHR